MNYKEVVEWLFNQVPNFQKTGAKAYKPGLDMIRSLLTSIDNPENKIRTIHVAGTNGKGSVSHILSAIFQAHGYKVGLFTSPHITDFRERIKINGTPVPESFVLDFVKQVRPFIEENNPSFFEITTAMAFDAFEKSNCDISIIETGLGGRLDSTNVIKPDIAVITNIGLDHTDFLGETLEEVAQEKAGIIKKDRPVVIGDLNPDLFKVFEDKAIELSAPLYYTAASNKKYDTDLLGEYQQRNIGTALCAVDVLKDTWQLKEAHIDTAIKNVKSISNFRGRLDQIEKNPLVIFDAGHNADGIENLMREVANLEFDKLHVLYGASNDKNIEEIARLFPQNASYYFTEFPSKRSTTIQVFEEIGKKNELFFKTFESPILAFQYCKSAASKEDLILVCGSFYLMEKII